MRPEGFSTAESELKVLSHESERRTLSILVLVYNEEENLIHFYDRLNRVVQSLPNYAAEIIFIDDGSKDNSLSILRTLCEKDARVKVLKLSRNFGSWNAIAAGVHSSHGDAVVWLTSDLQDPPELLGPLVSRWEEGAHIVWAVRTQRDDPWPRTFMATLFYWILRRIALPNYPTMGMDICLMDRKAAQVFRQLKEHNRFTQGLIMYLGFTQATVPYKRERRYQGRSKWGNLPRLAKMGADMIVGSSYFPLRAMIYIGVVMFTSSVLLSILALVVKAANGSPVATWIPVVLTTLAVGGINITMLGILGEYLWRVLEEVRDRPLYIVQDRIGFDGNEFPPYAPQERQETVSRRENQ